jgi:L-fuconate dehydratase
MIQHYGMWDQIAVSGHSETQLVEYIDFLQESVEHPVIVREGCYVSPKQPGWGIDFLRDFIERHRFPTGSAWRTRSANRKGVIYEV